MDLTKITTPYGLLDADTQKALREHGGPYEEWTGEKEWLVIERATHFRNKAVYRVKPQPPKPREWWIGFHSNGCYVLFKAEQDGRLHGWKPDDLVRVREVLE